MATVDLPDRTRSTKPSTGNAILHSLVSIAAKAVNAQLHQFVLRMSGALMEFSDACADSKQVILSFHASKKLKSDPYAFHLLALKHVERSFQREVNALESPFKASAPQIDAALSLVPYEVMDKKVLLGNLARQFDNAHSDQLSALRTRLARLLMRDELSNSQNPFRPEVLLSAINDTWCEFNTDPEAHSILLPLLRRDVFLDLTPIMTALNGALIKSGILPDMTDCFTIKKSGNQDGGQQQSSRLGSATMEQLRQIFSPQCEMQAGAPVYGSAMSFGNTSMPGLIGAQGMPGAPIIPGSANSAGYGEAISGAFQGQPWQASISSQLLGFLAGMQRNQMLQQTAGSQNDLAINSSMLADIKAQAPQGTLTRVDESTIDLLSKIFEVVFRDQNIPAEIKGLIGCLQIPVLQTALVDKDFFFKEEHPARHLIELLIKTSVGWDQSKGKDDPLFQTIKRNIDRVQEEYDHQATVFSEVASDLESFIEQEESEAAEALAQPIAEALAKEKLGASTKAAKKEVAMRIGTGEVATFIETFLENKWVPVLTLAHSIEKDKPEAVASALKTMDDLVWSVKPKITPEERKGLIAKLPPMLCMLNKWLKLVNLDESDQQRFFAELAECHASIVRAPLEMSPQRQLEIAMNMAKQAAERRLEMRASQEKEEEEQKLHMQEEQQQEEEEEQSEPGHVPENFANRVENLERGMWLEFIQVDETVKKVKLSWISPLRSLFIFSSRDKADSFSLSVEDLTQALREHRAKVILLSGLVDRAITEALGANDADIHEMSAA